MQQRPVLWRVMIALAVLAVSAVVALTTAPTLGLDLRGGTQIVLETRDTEEVPADAAATDRVLEVLRGRVDGLGVAEPSLTRSGENRIIVELPGLTDPAEAAETLGRTAQLTMHPVLGTGAPEAAPTADETGQPLQLGPPALQGDMIASAQSVPSQQSVGFEVQVGFDGEGPGRWQALTGQAACAPPGDPQRRVAIVLDDQVISSPQVDPSIACQVGMVGGQTTITGNFSQEQANELSVLIEGGALPVPVEIIEQRTVGPTLGADAISASAWAAIIGSALTAVFLIVVYRLVGVVAVVALGGYALTAYAVQTGLGATLTLPGLAAFVLAVGMAVDANVLIAERSREEYAARPRLERASENGYRFSLSAVGDAAVTSLLAAVLLFGLASGPVRGFGVTLVIGVVVSLFSALVLSRLLTLAVLRIPAVRRRPRITGIAAIGPVRQRLEARDPGFLRNAAKVLAVAGVVLVVAVSGLFVRGLELGVEFTGGRLVEFTTTNPITPEQAREAVTAAGYPNLQVTTTGDGAVGLRAGELADAEVAALRDSVAAAGGGAEVLRDEMIGPSLGEELARGGLIALGVALAAQFLYLAFRFRWTLGAGAVAALLANVLVVVGVFAWTGRTLDGVFLAALLTVIGYSVNDTVVVFDRVREHWARRAKDPFHRVVGSAVLSTLPRTVNTGVSTLMILVMLLLLGGATLADFALALIIGIVVGTISTIVVAGPVAILLERRWGGTPPRAGKDKQPVGKAGRRNPSRADRARTRNADGAVV
ncbi:MULTISPECIES: protein translocase subunit SecD [unclassified Pseudonocardia]|uniref:protein translocase subunit SecD n=1 Tax=unclassified Pseudonocardia TaxID=2619320 RepID=UPI000964E749|nr:protein translocase subunit SecD [Pseudonocardia sp. Ae707_Ps1]OLM17994.1 Protein-export membrane protein SecD / Protein-export membrane protein SecF [Pseudonocardia sp. Ae707_Ps1]